MKRMIGVLLAALALDAGTKWLASELLAGRTVALGWLVELRLTRNDGTELLATALDHACRRLGCAARDGKL